MQMPALQKHPEILCLHPSGTHAPKHAKYQTGMGFSRIVFVFPTWVNSHIKQPQLANIIRLCHPCKFVFSSDLFFLLTSREAHPPTLTY